MRRRAILLTIAAPLAVPVAVLLAVAFTLVAVGSGSLSSGEVPAGGVSGSQLRAGVPVPPQYVGLVRQAVSAAGCPQLTESVLAAQIHQESGWNPRAVSPAGAMGIAQFMPGTWPNWGEDENGNGVASPWEPEDAIPAAARYDCGIARALAAVPGDPAALMLAGYNAGPAAVLAYRGIPPYQETQNYVRVIVDLAQTWAAAPGLIGRGLGPAAGPGPAHAEATGNAIIDGAVAWALAQTGSWYQYGGACTNPFGPGAHGRCDCSSLMQQAYAHAGVALPRTAAEQSRVGMPVRPGEIIPGDLVAMVGGGGSVSRPGHIAMYIGFGYAVHAPYTGARVQVVPVRGFRDVVTIRRIVTG